MKAKLLVTLLVFMFVAVAPSFAQDGGDPDTLLLLTSRPEVGGDDSTLTVELWAWHDADPYLGISIGFTWVNDNLILISHENLTGWGFAFLDDGGIANSNATKHFQFAGFGLALADTLPRGTTRQIIARWSFILTDWQAGHSIVIDTNEYDAGVAYEVTGNDGSGSVDITPVWYKGDNPLIIQDPSDAESGDNDLVPADYGLSQNYPNPFNPDTQIPFALPVAGEWELSIYNVLGQEVTTFQDISEAGYHEVRWRASDYSSGVYFYKLTAGDFTETKKMVLVK